MPGPHDLFARFTFGHPERAAAELRTVLPPEVASKVDWSSLRRESGSVVDPELRESQSDLLFSARLLGGQPLLLYFLLEHQSTVDRWMAFRMLRYVVRQLEHWQKENPESAVLPVVIPLVMYHGPEGAWTAPRQVEELFALPSEGAETELLRARVPRFEYLLDDLTAEREEALRARPGPPLARLTLLLLRHGRAEELARRLEGWRALLTEVYSSPEGLEQLRAVVHYLLRVDNQVALGAIRQVLDSVAGAQRAEELMKSTGDLLIEQGHQQGWLKGLAEGRAEGKAEGRAEGKAEGLAEGLAEGRAQAQVEARADAVLRILAARGIAVDEGTRKLILSCTDLVTLDRWFDRALNATRLSDLRVSG